MTTDEKIKELAHKRYGTDPNSFGGQRDGFIEGYKMSQESLQGIENNNGWIKIESEKDLPKENGEYHIINSKNEMWRYNFDNNDRIKNCTWLTEITHYQPIVKPDPPIY